MLSWAHFGVQVWQRAECPQTPQVTPDSQEPEQRSMEGLREPGGSFPLFICWTSLLCPTVHRIPPLYTQALPSLGPLSLEGWGWQGSWACPQELLLQEGARREEEEA